MKLSSFTKTMAAALIAVASIATSIAGMHEGVMMKDGKMMVMKDGKTMMMEKEMTMTDGTKVMTDGAVMMKDGTKKMMKDGEMIMMDGKMMKHDHMKDEKMMETK